jgi:hypothetical protein
MYISLFPGTITVSTSLFDVISVFDKLTFFTIFDGLKTLFKTTGAAEVAEAAEFAKVADEFESLIPCLSDAHDTIAQAVAEQCCEHDAHENYCDCCISICEKC